MPRLYLDTPNGSEAVAGPAGENRIVRGAIVAGLDTTAPAEVLIKALSVPGMPARDSILSPAYPRYTLRRYAVRAIRGRMALLRLIYEEPPLDTPPETFAAEDVTTLSTGTTMLVPGTLEPLRVSFNNTVTASDLAAGDTAVVSFPQPLRSLVLTGLYNTPPDLSLLAALRHVNHADFQGLPKGYWLYTGVRVQFSNRDRKYQVTCTVTTKITEDWSSIAATRNPADGKFAEVPAATQTKLRNQVYEKGIRHQANGLLKVGLFDTVNMSALFGTILDRMP